MTEIAFASGYQSLRRFNAAVRQAFRRTPSQLRSVHPAVNSSPDGPLRIRLECRQPYDWPGVTAHLELYSTECAEQIGPAIYRRAIRAGSGVGLLEVASSPDRRALDVSLHIDALRELPRLVARVRRLFDADANAVDIAATLEKSASIARSVRINPGLRVPGAWDGCKLALSIGLRLVLGSQLQRAWMAQLARSGACSAHDLRVFPSAREILECSILDAGLAAPAARMSRRICELAMARAELFAGLAPYDDVASALHRHCALPEGAAAYVAMRVTNHPDVPGPEEVCSFIAAPRGRQTRRIIEQSQREWMPWRSYGMLHAMQCLRAHEARDLRSRSR